MSKAPYPGYPPACRTVNKTGGYDRTCLVVEILSDGGLGAAQLAHIQEQIEALLSRMLPATVEKTQVVLPDRFDPILKEGLRIS